ncbi:transmembrane protein 184C-like [Amphiura filiformis]|uniref:transmembrane protein 184C-like n=1 Tax=Amphiura filiformis TaxID=82378 RepID=UPI003B2190AC
MDATKPEEEDNKVTAPCPENGVIPVDPMSTYVADHNWKIWLRRTVYVTYFTFMLLIIPVLIYELVRNVADFSILIWFLAGMATIFAVPISLWGILNHLLHFTQPALQRKILRILWMVPVYGIFSWLALTFPKARVFLDAVREIYQAYVVYNFITYLITFLTAEYDMDTRMKEKPQVKSPPPCCCFKPGKNELVINRCKYGVLNYTVSRPILTIVAIICEFTGNYDDGSLSISFAWIWITLILAASQLWAIYCLVLLYRSTKEELQPLYKPYAQFLCVKMTIFGANFQGLIIAVLVDTGALSPNPAWGMSDAEFAALVQDFVVCFEMVIASLAHAYSFAYKPYKLMPNRLPFRKALKMMFTIDDVTQDVAFHVKRVGRKIKRKFTKQPKDDNELVTNEETPDGAPIEDNTDEDGDGECDLGTVSQINNVTYSANGQVKWYPKAPTANGMAPRGAPGTPNHDDIVDILGQAEAALEENSMKDSVVGKNAKSDSFASSSDGMDLGMGMVGVPAPLGSPTRRMSKKGVMIDYEMDSEPVGDTETVDLTFDDKNQNSLIDDSEA